jgi:plastocyanin
MKHISMISTLLATLSLAANAQTLSGIKVEPASVKVGEPVKITGSFENADNPNCNVRVNYGEGPTQNFKINQLKDVPLVTTHTYAKPGTYKVAIEPRTAMPMLKCVGKDQSATVTVVAAAPVAAAAPAGKAMAAGPACPAGWKLNAKSVNKKTGAYTCGAKAGTAAPTAKPDCAAPLGYFENKSKGQFGCRP